MLPEKLSEKNKDISAVWSIISLEFIINEKRRSNMSAKISYGILKGIQEAGRTSFSVDEVDQKSDFIFLRDF